MLSSEPDSEGLSNIQTPTSFGHQNTPNQASSDEDGRLRTVHLSIWTTDQNLGSDRPSRGQIRTLDQDYNFEVDRPRGRVDRFLTMDRPDPNAMIE